MKKNDPIARVMSAAPLTVQKGQPLSAVRKLMADNDFHHVPVLDGEKAVGMVSTSDLLKLSFDGVDSRSLDAMLDHQYRLDQVMTTELAKVPKSGHVRDAAEALADGGLHSVLVVDEGDRLAGIVTSTDVIRYLVEQY